MHQFKIEVFKYTEAGAPTNERVAKRYADTLEQAKSIYEEYKDVRYINEDGSQGGKMYQIKMYNASWHQITDIADFFSGLEV